MGARGTVDLIYINQHILKKCKTMLKEVAIAWTDNKKNLRHITPKLNNRLSINV